MTLRAPEDWVQPRGASLEAGRVTGATEGALRPVLGTAGPAWTHPRGGAAVMVSVTARRGAGSHGEGSSSAGRCLQDRIVARRLAEPEAQVLQSEMNSMERLLRLHRHAMHHTGLGHYSSTAASWPRAVAGTECRSHMSLAPR